MKEDPTKTSVKDKTITAGTLVLSKSYTPTDCLDYRRSADCETLREELIDRTSHGEIPDEAIDTWWGEVVFEGGLFVVYIYYRPEEK